MAATWMSLPSKVKTQAESALQRLSTAAAIVSNTGCASDGEAAITRRISLVAACCSRASANCAPSVRGLAAFCAGDLVFRACLALAAVPRAVIGIQAASGWQLGVNRQRERFPVRANREAARATLRRD